ncbi:hypothetical protein ACTJJE_06290 [Mycolicibacterium sp. 22603]|uniref:hypothetical protein n=1 Tax=Mycolicibacterium sp. 22603 TaxID=3453950 RepID=UPI003F86F629
MLAAIALIPSAPILVPELAGAAAAEVADLRSAVLTVGAQLPSRWIALAAGPSPAVVGPQAVGTFAGYGADIVVTLSPDPDGPVADLPLAALITGWVRANAAPDAVAEVHIIGPDTDAGSVRAALDATGDPIGVLVVADGATTLTATAPGGFVPDSVPEQTRLDDALAAGDIANLAGVAAGAAGRDAYRVAAELVGSASVSASELYRGAPYGVGYFVGLWRL